MNESESFDQLLQRAVEDKHAEPMLLRALLDATVYAHAPRHDRSGRLRLIQFTLPTGQLVLPFFSERKQAVVAAGRSAKIVAMTGRQLFELTRGATLMLNPNGTHCVLYPEEIAALLDRGEVAVVEKVERTDLAWHVRAPTQVPGWLIDALIALYAQLVYVEAAYLAELEVPGASDEYGWVVALAVPAVDAERAARATTTQLQALCERHASRSVDVTAFDPGSAPAWLGELEVTPFYERRWGKRLMAPARSAT